MLSIKKCFLIIICFSIFVLTACEIAGPVTSYNVSFVAGVGGSIRGELNQKVAEGKSTSIIKAIPDDGYYFAGWSDGVLDDSRIIENVTEDLTVEAIFKKEITTFPALYIDTNNVGIYSKEEYVTCTVTCKYPEMSEYEFTDLAAKIRGRGNSSWSAPKKPYKLKFDKKIDLFGNGSAKTWTLIANYDDPSRIRNYLVYTLANILDDDEYTTTCQFAEIYLNGEYNGLYLICEQVEVGKNRVDINVDIDNYPSFLIELDARAPEEGVGVDYDYFYIDGIPYGIKDPDTEDELYTKDVCLGIKDFVSYCYNLIKNRNSYEDVENIMDVGSFADGFIVQELFGNVDVKYSSWYMYRDKGGKLCNGPLWDFDISAGNCDYDNEVINPNTIYSIKNAWYRYLLAYDEFQILVKEKLTKYNPLIVEHLDRELNKLIKFESYFLRDDNKWHVIGNYVWPNPKELVNIKTWQGHINYVEDWVLKKLSYLIKYFYV